MASNTKQHWYIAHEKLKEKYQDHARRINAYCKEIERECSTKIDAKVMRNGTVRFVVTGPRSGVNKAVRYIQGEFTNSKASSKIDPQAEGEPLPAADVQGISGPREAARIPTKEEQTRHSQPLTEANLRKFDLLTGTCDLRQFGCGSCDHPWWRIVPKKKPVSHCSKCRVRYDALPRDQEFGIGRYVCSHCNSGFYARCTATESRKCFKCKKIVSNPFIHPKIHKEWLKSKSPSSRKPKPPEPSAIRGKAKEAFVVDHDLVPAFFQLQIPFPDLPPADPSPSLWMPPVQSVKFQARRKVINESTPHDSTRSTGSTVSTWLTQLSDSDDSDDFDEEYIAGTTWLTQPSESGDEYIAGTTVRSWLTQPSESGDSGDEDGEEKGVGACKFQCACGNGYTVLCEMTDTAECYRCHTDNYPIELRPPRPINSRTAKPHSCSKCNGRGNCPNLKRLHRHPRQFTD